MWAKWKNCGTKTKFFFRLLLSSCAWVIELQSEGICNLSQTNVPKKEKILRTFRKRRRFKRKEWTTKKLHAVKNMPYIVWFVLCWKCKLESFELHFYWWWESSVSIVLVLAFLPSVVPAFIFFARLLKPIKIHC